MPVDPYALCPCGSGKKLKFCCGDLAGEIEKIHRMIEGDQPRAALRHAEQTLSKHPGRASLLDLKAALELSLEELEAARATIGEFVAKHADSPNAHACQALLLAETGDATGAVRAIQRALELVDHDLPHRVLEAIGIVGRALLASGHVLSAQAHLWLNAAISPPDDTRSRELLVGLNHYSGLPLILRDQLSFRPSPENAAWKPEAQQAAHLADHGRWQQATAAIDRLGQKYGADPTLVFNRALLGGWLADERALAAGLHAFAQMEVPLDDAVEAEAIAQLLDPDQREEPLDSVVVSYEIADLDALVTRFSGDPRVESFNVDPASMPSDQPRPRNTYVLLDKPMPKSGENLARADVPRLAAILAIFGRQTDRRERLEVTIDKGPAFAATMTALREIAAESLGPQIDEQVVGQVSPTEQALNWRWNFPRDTPREVRRQLIADERVLSIVERWPEVARPGLGGKSPREAASDPQLRVPLLAAVLLLEQGGNIDRNAEAVAQLRSSLNLPQPEPIDGAGIDGATIPLVRIPRVQLSSVSDDTLLQLYRRALLVGANAALLDVGHEIVRRPALAERIPPGEVYRRMIAVEADPERALALVEAARLVAAAADQSVAPWELAELQLHIASGNAAKFQEVMGRIEREHLDDPQVAQQLYGILYEAGLIPADGMAMPAIGDDEEMAAAVGTAPEPAAGRIWTPDSERPSGGKSSLWTPS